jgi:hypothetical protein
LNPFVMLSRDTILMSGGLIDRVFELKDAKTGPGGVSRAARRRRLSGGARSSASPAAAAAGCRRGWLGARHCGWSARFAFVVCASPPERRPPAAGEGGSLCTQLPQPRPAFGGVQQPEPAGVDEVSPPFEKAELTGPPYFRHYSRGRQAAVTALLGPPVPAGGTTGSLRLRPQRNQAGSCPERISPAPFSS